MQRSTCIIGCLICCLTLISCGTTQTASPSQLSASTPEKQASVRIAEEGRQVGILDFKILAQDDSYAYLSSEIPQSLTSAFLNGGVIQPVERQEFENIDAEIMLSMSYADAEEVLRLGKLLGADYMLLGSLTILGSQAKIVCRLIETETGQIIFSDSSVGAMEELFRMEEELADSIEARIVR